MLLSGCSVVCSQPDIGARHICFCHSWQQPAADKRSCFQLVFFCSDCFHSMDIVFLPSAYALSSLLCETESGSRCPSTFLNLMVHGLTSYTSETEQTRVRPFHSRKQSFTETLCLYKLPVRGAECKLYAVHVSLLGRWKGRDVHAFISISILLSPSFSKAPEGEGLPVLWQQPTHKLHTSCGRWPPLLKCCSSPKSFTSGAADNGLLAITWLCSWTATVV